jgi:hypothetical protein
MDYPDGMNCDEGMQSKIAGKQWAALHVISDDRDVRAHRGMVCMRVRDYFEQHFRSASASRVVCIFDDKDNEQLKQACGVANRGTHWPIRGQGLVIWPNHFWELIAWYDEKAGKVILPYTSVIYLHGSTCETDIGFTLTFAHELQHFLQYTNEKLLWIKNTLLIALHNEEFKVWWDFPIEIEARITAKKVAESLFGTESVKEYIQERIKAHITENDAEDWKFVQSIDTAISYSLEEGTRPLVQRHRRQLEEHIQRCKDDAQVLKNSGLRLEELVAVEFDAPT